MLEAQEVCRVVDGEQWLTDVDLDLGPGLHVVAGQSLAGKTTLMRILAGLDRPDTGAVLVDGADVTGMPVRRRDVAFVYQEFINYPSMSAGDNIATPLRRAGDSSPDEIARRVDELARLLALGPYLDRRPSELSGGQQQRVAIARALAKRSSLLFLDEPLANLDYKLREELRDELASIFGGDEERTVIYSTSEPAEALHFGVDTVIIHEGRILQTGPAIELYRQPATATVARVFSDPPMNLLAAHLDGDRLELGDDHQFSTVRPPQFEPLASGPITVGIRPHQVSLEPVDADELRVSGAVTLAELTGSDTFVHLDAAGVTLVAEAPGVHNRALGETMPVYLQPVGLYAFDVESGSLLAAPALREVRVRG